jgi:hypothetical protein
LGPIKRDAALGTELGILRGRRATVRAPGPRCRRGLRLEISQLGLLGLSFRAEFIDPLAKPAQFGVGDLAGVVEGEYLQAKRLRQLSDLALDGFDLGAELRDVTPPLDLVPLGPQAVDSGPDMSLLVKTR